MASSCPRATESSQHAPISAYSETRNAPQAQSGCSQRRTDEFATSAQEKGLERTAACGECGKRRTSVSCDMSCAADQGVHISQCRTADLNAKYEPGYR